MSEEIRGTCWSCGQGLTAADYAREGTCPGCGKQTHVCRNCRHYLPGRRNDCFEPMAERVVDKLRANFCDYFEPGRPKGSASGAPAPDDLRRAAEELFKR